MRDAISPSCRARITHEIARAGVWRGTRAGVHMRITHSGDADRPIRAQACIHRRWISETLGTVFEAAQFLNDLVWRKRAGGGRAA